MPVKRYRARGEISSSREKEDKSDIRDNIDPEYADDKYLLSLQYWNEIWWKLQVTKVGYTSIHQLKYEIYSSSTHFIMRTTSEIFQ